MNDTTLVMIAVGLSVVVVAITVLNARLLKPRKTKPGGMPANLAASLQDEKLKSEIILNSIEDGVVLFDAEGVVQLFNPAASNLTGWAGEEAKGLQVTAVIKLVNEKGEPYPDEQNPFMQIYSATGTIRDNKAVLVSRAGKQFMLSLSISPLKDQEGSVKAAVAIFRDITQEKQEEKQRAEFISTASHEMRTPVAAIEGYLALAMNDKVSTIDSRAKGFLEKAHASTQHLGQLFQDLLTSAKAEDGRLTSHPVVMEVGNFIEQLASDLKFSAEKKGLLTEFIAGSTHTIDARADSAGSMQKVVKPLYFINADPDRLREVITNLFDNAVKYTDQGKISLGLTGDDKVVQIYVRDTGPGIPREDIPHLFQKFYRVDNSATRTIGGTGLGLFICRKIVELYQGRIWVESELGKGSSFYINFPRLTPDQAKKLQASEGNKPGLQPVESLTNA